MVDPYQRPPRAVGTPSAFRWLLMASYVPRQLARRRCSGARENVGLDCRNEVGRRLPAKRLGVDHVQRMTSDTDELVSTYLGADRVKSFWSMAERPPMSMSYGAERLSVSAGTRPSSSTPPTTRTNRAGSSAQVPVHRTPVSGLPDRVDGYVRS